MKKYLYILLLLMVMPSGLRAQEAAITFEELEYDFGDIPELGGAASHRFVYTNTGTVPLILKSVHTSCGCTSPAWSKEPVAPTKSGYIDVTFDPRDRPGAFTKSIIVSSNAKESSVTLYISGIVEPRPEPISATYPYSMFDLRLKSTTVNFGKVDSKESASHEIEVINPTKANIVIEPDREKTPAFVSIAAKPSVLKPGEKGVIKCTFDASKCPQFDMVQLSVPILVNTYSYNLHLKCQITEHFTEKDMKNPPELTILNPETLNMGDMTEGEARILKIQFRNDGTSPLKIRAIRNACDCITYKIETPEVAPGATGSIQICFDSTGKTGQQNRYITIISNCPQKQQMVCKLTANVAKPAN